MNKLFQQLNPTRKLSLPNNVKQMISMVKGARNPQQMVQKMVNENPQFMAMLQMSNGNPEQAFKSLAKQMGVDPNEIIDLIK